MHIRRNIIRIGSGGMKIAIVGAEESKWNEEQKEIAKREIKHIIAKHSEHVRGTFNCFGSCSNITIVSGHCPRGGVDIWAEEVADKLGIHKEIYSAEVNQWKDKIIKDETSGDWHQAPKKYVLKGFRSRNIQIARVVNTVKELDLIQLPMMNTL